MLRSQALAALLFAALLAVAATVSGCGEDVLVPNAPPDIRGTIDSVQSGGGGGGTLLTMLVSADDPEEAEFEQAVVAVSVDTRLLEGTPEEASVAEVEDISEGREVMVWFDGPVRESFPIQADAGTLLLLR